MFVCCRQVSKAEGTALAAELDCLFYETTAAEEYDCVATVFTRLIADVHADKYGVPLQPLFIAEERATPRDPLHVRQRPKSPKGTASEKKDEKNPQKKNFSKLFKICLLYTSPSPRDISGSRMPSYA